ncbi:hypothetical protein GUJ93_ZPchr0014g46891 [Zizania palustris]|uniref:Uncharacterized protein n=1 Tax=Zizania palustris TaxID=103762 RepID=A0A8J5TH32_ZIZPA|nr:hypothetical protein GUJ93_ZPchr0014g46891 [Zizania palustris]
MPFDHSPSPPRPTLHHHQITTHQAITIRLWLYLVKFLAPPHSLRSRGSVSSKLPWRRDSDRWWEGHRWRGANKGGRSAPASMNYLCAVSSRQSAGREGGGGNATDANSVASPCCSASSLSSSTCDCGGAGASGVEGDAGSPSPSSGSRLWFARRIQAVRASRRWHALTPCRTNDGSYFFSSH